MGLFRCGDALHNTQAVHPGQAFLTVIRSSSPREGSPFPCPGSVWRIYLPASIATCSSITGSSSSITSTLETCSSTRLSASLGRDRLNPEQSVVKVQIHQGLLGIQTGNP